ncbi:MAG: hydrogenase maturation protease [Myxococcales bacterium]|nr:hydrogenase maturation protease [Myxococcales bacterium]
MTVQVIALGSRTACDDEVALLAAERLAGPLGPRARVMLAGRPGPGLVDLLEPERPTVVMDVIMAGLPPGRVVRIPLHELTDATLAGRPLSSHGFGPAEALRLARSLGRSLPPGTFVGIEGHHLTPGQGIDPRVEQGIDAMVDAVLAAVAELAPATNPGVDPCTSPE